MTGSSFQELPETRCRELLAGRHAGRVAWNAPEGPQLLPVTYAVYAGDVVFRTSPYGALSQLRRRTNVAFEIDDIDEEHGTGWSVLVLGSAKAVANTDDLARLWSSDVIVPWASGTRNLFIAITARTVTGRIIRAPWSTGDSAG